MDIAKDILDRIGQHESELLEYKAVLPPAATVAQLIAAFANTKGGAIVLGVVDQGKGVLINGLSDEFRAVQITRKAIDLLSPAPAVKYDYVDHQGKRLFVIEVQKSAVPVLLGGKSYVRQGFRTALTAAAPEKSIKNAGIASLSAIFMTSRKACTAARAKLLDHYESVLLILDDLAELLYPIGSSVPTDNAEGKMLMRILFSSCADNFEIFMSDLLYEIYLAKPETLKSSATVTVKEVLDCSDMQEFIGRYAKEKLKKLQRGSAFTAKSWEKDHVSTLYGSAANTPWSKTALGGNAFGPYQLHIKELDGRGIMIHGTMGPGWSPTTWGNSLFLSPTSHGCIRMCNRDDIDLHTMMPNPAGNKIIIGTTP